MKIKLLAVTLATLYAVSAYADNKLDLGPSLNPGKSSATVATSAVPGAVEVPGKAAAPTPVSTGTIAPVLAPVPAATAAPGKLMQPPSFAAGKPSAAPAPEPVVAKPVTAPPAPPAKPPAPKVAPVAAAPAPLMVAAPVQLQPTAPPVADAAQVPVAPQAPQAVVPGESPKPTMNPFTGRPREVETATREIELLKLKTQALEEQLRQVNIREDMHNIPLRKQVEAAQATTAILKEYSMQKGTSAEIVRPAAKFTDSVSAASSGEVAKPKAKVTTKPKRKSADAAKAEEPAPAAKAAVPVVPALPKVDVSSIISVKGSRSAVLTAQEGSMVVMNGEDTPWGRVLILDDSNITLGGRPYKVHQNTVSRLVVSDPKPVDPTKANIATPGPVAAVAAVTAPASVPGANANLPPLLPPTDANRGLPPLQLPPGVKILPAAPNIVK